MTVRSLVLVASCALAVHACNGGDYSLGHPAPRPSSMDGGSDGESGGQSDSGEGGGGSSSGASNGGRGGGSGATNTGGGSGATNTGGGSGATNTGGGSGATDTGGMSGATNTGGMSGVGPVRAIATGDAHTCALDVSGAVSCWGWGMFGMLGYGNMTMIGDDETPASVGPVDVGGAVQQLSAGDTHTCALLRTGAVRCWGYVQNGNLGYGNTNWIGDDETPASAGDVDVGGEVEQIEAGGNHTCALLTTGVVRCWGDGRYGALGYGNQSSVGGGGTPASAGDVDVGGAVQQIATGRYHTCALLMNGAVRCWGMGDMGQLGYGNTTSIGDSETPASAGDVDVGGTVQQIAARATHTCALLTTGTVRCWGQGEHGQLGYGSENIVGDDETPASVGDVNVGGTVQQITTGSSHTCALLATGAVRCWGLGLWGELGYGDTNAIGDDETPASAGDINFGATVQQIAAGGVHTCVLTEMGTIRCTGHGAQGALGYGNSNMIGDDETPASAGDVKAF